MPESLQTSQKKPASDSYAFKYTSAYVRIAEPARKSTCSIATFNCSTRPRAARHRQLYRVAAKHGLLDDVEAWWDFHEARNMTSHTYSPPIALEVASKARLFDTACGQLISQLKAQSSDE